jgi:tRNA (cytidine/uridine-2'-O-)-methyltransferase
MLLHIVLFEPEIPHNTGNIIRLCANTGATLHLIHPLGFAWDSAKLRRAGLDYYEWVPVQHHTSLQACREAIAFPRLLAFSTKGTCNYHEMAYQQGDALLFGPESRGLPAYVLASPLLEQVVRIPMQPTSRSLNLSNAVAIVLYEAWRQLGFVGGR